MDTKRSSLRTLLGRLQIIWEQQNFRPSVASDVSRVDVLAGVLSHFLHRNRHRPMFYRNLWFNAIFYLNHFFAWFVNYRWSWRTMCRLIYSNCWFRKINGRSTSLGSAVPSFLSVGRLPCSRVRRIHTCHLGCYQLRTEIPAPWRPRRIRDWEASIWFIPYQSDSFNLFSSRRSVSTTNATISNFPCPNKVIKLKDENKFLRFETP